MSVHRFSDWVVDTALPFWLDNGVRRETKLFHERLRLDGGPDHAAPLRVRTQFRQIYLLAHASVLGLAPDETALHVAVTASRRLRKFAFDRVRRGWVHRLDAEGRVVDPTLDLYDQAFALNALLWLAHATGEPEFLTGVEEIFATLDNHFARPSGGYAESDRGGLPRRQNPHMHLFEAAIAGMDLGYADITAPLAARIFRLFNREFFDPETGRLTEFFGPCWEKHDSYGSDCYEPGHAAEWVWLLTRYARLTGATVKPTALELLASVRRTRAMQDNGFLPDVADAEGKAMSPGCRLWPQLEFLKALISLPSPANLREADRFADQVFSSYVAPAPRGCWFDSLDLAGRPSADHVPASIMYHLFSLAAEVDNSVLGVREPAL